MARATIQNIIASFAIEEIIAVPTAQGVSASSAVEDVVARAAIKRVVTIIATEDVIAAIAFDDVIAIVTGQAIAVVRPAQVFDVNQGIVGGFVGKQAERIDEEGISLGVSCGGPFGAITARHDVKSGFPVVRIDNLTIDGNHGQARYLVIAKRHIVGGAIGHRHGELPFQAAIGTVIADNGGVIIETDIQKSHIFRAHFSRAHIMLHRKQSPNRSINIRAFIQRKRCGRPSRCRSNSRQCISGGKLCALMQRAFVIQRINGNST